MSWTPLGEAVHAHVVALRAQLAADLQTSLAGYSAAELATVARLVGDLDAFDPGADYRYAAGLCAALMAGWAALLVWADRTPSPGEGFSC